MRRRTFIQHTALAAAGAMLSPAAVAGLRGTRSSAIGLQLYTLKDIIRKDVKGTLQKVAEIGYKELEAYSYGDGKIFGMPYQDFSTMAKDLGMSIVSGHYGTGKMNPNMKGSLINDWERATEDAAGVGQKYMVIAWLAPDERKTVDDYKRTCELLNKSSEVCRRAGVTLGYHNHEFEFEKIEGQVPYEVMLAELDASVIMELDIYWSTFSGFEALDLFKKYPGRFPLWHVKDMDKQDRKKNSDVGSGSIDYKAIFAGAGQAGLKHFFLEQEYFTGSQIDSISKGYQHLAGIV
jgi:sugar phosphate isomerase/epimerase